MSFELPHKQYIVTDDRRYGQAFQALEDAINRISQQGKLNPVDTSTPSPTQISPPVKK